MTKLDENVMYSSVAGDYRQIYDAGKPPELFNHLRGLHRETDSMQTRETLEAVTGRVL